MSAIKNISSKNQSRPIAGPSRRFSLICTLDPPQAVAASGPKALCHYPAPRAILYLSGIRAWSQSPMRDAEGLSRLHNTITDWPDSEY